MVCVARPTPKNRHGERKTNFMRQTTFEPLSASPLFGSIYENTTMTKENTELDELQRRLHDAHESSAILRAKIAAVELENTKLKREIMHAEDGYKKLAAHHNRECTCMEIY